jgi:uncharacterized integral membrane protein (TIGR00698 family)
VRQARLNAAGIVLCGAIGGAAYGLGRALPEVGGPVFALLLGVLVRLLASPGAWANAGIRFCSRTVLQVAIVLLGFGIGLGTVGHVGLQSLPVMLGSLAAALVGAAVLGRLLGIGGTLTTLIGVGTGICGASAIAAVSGIVAATGVEIGYAISTIFLFNVAAVILFPPIGHLLGLGQLPFGLWAGTAVNDTSSVVAAAYAYGSRAGDYAVVVKLTRTTMIIPIALGLLAWQIVAARRARAEPTARRGALLPWFLVWFVAASLVNSAGLVGHALQERLATAALVLIAVALAGVGLSIRIADIRRTGLRPLVLGAALWAIVSVSSLLLQAATGKL